MAIRTALLISWCITLVMPLTRGGDASPYAANHRVSLDPGRQLALVTGGEPVAEIVVGDAPSPVVAFAAEELQTVVRQATNATLPIVPGPTAGKTAIRLGDSPWARERDVDVSGLPRDAFVIRAIAGDIVIAGRDDPAVNPKRGFYLWGFLYERGTLFGVYEFLERFLDARFYFLGYEGTLVPRREELSVPSMDIYEAPDFDIRSIRMGSDSRLPDGRIYGEERWFRAHSGLRWRMNTHYIPCCHGLSRRGYLERFGESNPEYFALQPNGKRDNDASLWGHRGHLCYSDEQVRNEIYLDAVAYLTGQAASSRNIQRNGRVLYDPSSHQPGHFDLCPQDGLGSSQWCQCPKCKHYWDVGKQSDFIWEYVVDIANRLKRDGIAGNVTCFAYSCYRELPDLELPDNLMVQVCLAGPWIDHLAAQRERNDRLVKGWNEKVKAGKVWLWNYMISEKRVPAGVPTLSTQAVSDYLRRMAPHIRGSRTQGGGGVFLHHYLNHYVFYRICWDSRRDATSILDEHHRRMFGPAAAAMGRFFQRIEDIFVKDLLGDTRETERGPVPLRPTETHVWEEVYTPQLFGELSGMFSQAEAAAREDPAALRRVRFFREHFLGPIEEARQAYAERKGDIRDLVHEVASTAEPVTIDGDLSDPAWAGARPLCLVPMEREEDSVVKTTVRPLWDRDHLYLAFDCEEPTPDAMLLTTQNEDNSDVWKDASIEIFLNPLSDRKTYYQLIVNAKGVMCDVKLAKFGANLRDAARDRDWDAGARVKTRILNDRWQLEIAIPVASLDVAGLKAGDTWVVNLNRSRNITSATLAENQLFSWSPFLAGHFHDIAHFGSFRFVQTLAEPTVPTVRNGSFERLKGNGLPHDWHLPQLDPETGAGTAVDATTYREGGHSIRVQNRSARRIFVTQIGLPLKPGKLVEGKKYRLSFWARGKDIEPLPEGRPSFQGGYANVYAGANIFWPPGKKYSGTFPWTKIAYVFTCHPPYPGTANKPDYIRLGLQDAGGTIWFDDVRIELLD